MKIVRYKDETGVKLGAVKGDGVIDLTRAPAHSLLCPTTQSNSSSSGAKRSPKSRRSFQTVRLMQLWQTCGCSPL